jgi:hypothetical protein
MNSFAVGDMNHDGKLDLYSSYATGYNEPSATDDVLWLNTTNNNNHFITFDLRGTASTRDALGARIYIYGDFGVQTREVRSGESYGTTNTFMCHFGLGTATGIDSAVIKWPSGIVTQLGSHPADQFITVTEGQCVSPDNIVTSNTPFVICGGQPLTMSAASGYVYEWNTGDTTQSITITTPGEYNVRVTDPATGCNSVSKTLTILSTPDETPTVTVSGAASFCGGDSVVLSGPASAAYLWSNGDTLQSTVVKSSGSYVLTIQGSCASFTSQPVTITSVVTGVTPPLATAVCEGNAATIQLGVNGTAYWFDSDSATTAVATGDTYVTPSLQQNAVYYVEARDTAFGISGKVGPEDNSMNSGGFFNGDQYQIFDVYKPIILKTVKVYSGSKKDRTIQLRDAANNVLKQLVINIDTGETVIALNWPVAAGTAYRLGWLAGSQPNLYRNSGNAAYPYTLNGLVSITGSSAGGSYYYAYYDWSVEEPPLACQSERVPVSVTVNPNPAVSLTGLDTLYYVTDASVTLNGVPSGGTFSGTGVNGNSFSPADATTGGPYAVTYSYTDGNGCTAEETQLVTVLADTSVNTGVAEISNVSAVKVFPNPSNGTFTIAFESVTPDKVEFSITDVLGKKVWETSMSSTVGANSSSIHLNDLSTGCYQLSVKTKEQQKFYRLIIE